MKAVNGHWFRADYSDEPCRFPDCGRPQDEHVESCGEWMDPRHAFRPALSSRNGFRCSRCGRRWGHSTHFGSRKNRSLWWDRWNGFWDTVRRRK